MIPCDLDHKTTVAYAARMNSLDLDMLATLVSLPPGPTRFRDIYARYVEVAATEPITWTELSEKRIAQWLTNHDIPPTRQRVPRGAHPVACRNIP